MFSACGGGKVVLRRSAQKKAWIVNKLLSYVPIRFLPRKTHVVQWSGLKIGTRHQLGTARKQTVNCLPTCTQAWGVFTHSRTSKQLTRVRIPACVVFWMNAHGMCSLLERADALLRTSDHIFCCLSPPAPNANRSRQPAHDMHLSRPVQTNLRCIEQPRVQRRFSWQKPSRQKCRSPIAALSPPLRRRFAAAVAAMAKSKNHTSHNQSVKAHKNGA